jgi:hypothetical protein
MLREVETLDGTGRLSPASAAAFPGLGDSVEYEINRLTWSVLDGSASPSDRNRLADLVRSQHASRPKAGKLTPCTPQILRR